MNHFQRSVAAVVVFMSHYVTSQSTLRGSSSNSKQTYSLSTKETTAADVALGAMVVTLPFALLALYLRNTIVFKLANLWTFILPLALFICLMSVSFLLSSADINVILFYTSAMALATLVSSRAFANKLEQDQRRTRPVSFWKAYVFPTLVILPVAYLLSLTNQGIAHASVGVFLGLVALALALRAYRVPTLGMENRTLVLFALTLLASMGVRMVEEVQHLERESLGNAPLSFADAVATAAVAVAFLLLIGAKKRVSYLSEEQVMQLWKTSPLAMRKLQRPRKSTGSLGWIPEDGGNSLVTETNEKYGWSTAGSLRGLSPRGDKSKRNIAFDFENIPEHPKATTSQENLFSQDVTMNYNDTAPHMKTPAPVESHDAGSSPDVDRAVTKLQAVHRGNIARRAYFSLKCRIDSAVTRLQAVHRGNLVRRHFSANSSSAQHEPQATAPHNTEVHVDSTAAEPDSPQEASKTSKKESTGKFGIPRIHVPKVRETFSRMSLRHNKKQRSDAKSQNDISLV